MFEGCGKGRFEVELGAGENPRVMAESDGAWFEGLVCLSRHPASGRAEQVVA